MGKNFFHELLTKMNWWRKWKGAIIPDLPDRLEKYNIYLVGENGHIWQAVMVCPCGCGCVIQLCVLPDVHPGWRYQLHEDGSVTIFPSIWRKTGCESHFFLRQGKIKWHSISRQASPLRWRILELKSYWTTSHARR